MRTTITPFAIKDLIPEAESLLLKEGEKFDIKSKKFICCLDNKDIVACPGSGKTTALVAKLYILSKFMPFDDGSGICVLTHTNVAVDIIKDRLGKRASKLFEHPNFIGTIQSFVDKFLAQPYYTMKYNHRIVSIDDDVAYGYIISRLRNWQAIERRPNYLKKLKDIRYNFDNKEIVNRKGEAFSYKPFTTQSAPHIIREIKTSKNNAISKGILFYDEAFSLANQYMTRYPAILKGVGKRFKYIFVDEMQDTNSVQNTLLDSLFTDSIIQKIGDPNQAIYEREEGIEEEDFNLWNPDPQARSTIRIPRSKRLSQSIANSIRRIAFNPETDLEGKTEIDIKPKMLFYMDINNVLPKFLELIREADLQNLPLKVFKAVGFVGKKKDDATTLPSYFPSFCKPDKKRMIFNSLREYLLTPPRTDGCFNIKPVSNAIINSLIRMLYLVEKGDPLTDNRPFSKTSFLDYMKTNHPDRHLQLFENLSKWSKKIIIHRCNDSCSNGEHPYPFCVYEEITSYAKDCLFPMLGANYDKISDFIEKDLAVDFQNVSSLQNFYSVNCNNNDIIIEVGTVHSVKGETHAATLFLDTKWYDYEVNRLKNFFMQCESDSERNESRKKRALHVIYVAMSRPTHLLCVAFKLPEGQPIKDYWENKPEEERLWEIIDC